MYEFFVNFNDGIDNLAIQIVEFFNSPFMLEFGEFICKIFIFFIIVLFLIILLLPIIICIKEKKMEEEIEEVEKTAKEIEETDKMLEKIELLEDSPAYKMSKVKVVKK